MPLAAGGQGSLVGTAVRVTTTAVPVNLTALGTLDWRFYGPPTSCSRGPCQTRWKAGGLGLSGAYATADPDPNFYGDYPHPTNDPNVKTSWSDGDVAAGPASENSINASSLNTRAVYFDAVAGTANRTLTVIGGGSYGAGITLQVTAHLSDGSAPDFVDTVVVPSYTRVPLIYTFSYVSASTSATLRVTLTRLSGPHYIFIQAAALSSTVSTGGQGSLVGTAVRVTTTAVPVNLTALGTLDWRFYGPPTSCSRGPCQTRWKAGGLGLSGAYATADPDPNFYGDYPHPTNDPNVKTSWSDGDVAAGPASENSINASSLNTRAVYFDAVAGTANRTLTVIGGGSYGAGITLQVTAHLSDGSAPDFVDTVVVPSYTRVPLIYTFSYVSASTSATLRVTLTRLSGPHYIFIQAAALANVGQTNQPVTGSSPSQLRLAATTITTVGQPLNLTAVGTTDWRYFGPPISCSGGPCFSRKKRGGFGIVGAYAALDPDWNFNPDYPNSLVDPNINTTWNDADTSTGGLSNGGGINSASINSRSAYLIALADTNQRTLTIVMGGSYSGAGGVISIAGHLTDDSAPDVSMMLTIPAYRRTPVIITLTYQAILNGANLRVTLVRVSGNASLLLQAAALSAPNSSVGPSTATLGLADDLQGFLNEARPGDTLTLPPGFTWTGNLVLKPKALAVDSTSGKALLVTVKSNISLGDGLRVNPGELMATLISPNSSPCIANDTANPIHSQRVASYYKFDGIKLTAISTLSYSLVSLGFGDNPTSADISHDIEFHHMYVHGADAVLNSSGGVVQDFESYRGFVAEANNLVIADSYVDNFRSRVAEANAIFTTIGQNHTYINNFLEGAGESIFVAGGATPLPPLIAGNITISHNYITHRSSWRGGPYVVKNNLETKGVLGMLVDGNLVENIWAAAQNGTSIVMTPRTNGGLVPSARVENVTLVGNIIRHAGSCMNFSVYDDGAGLSASQLIPSNHIVIQNNLCDDISRHKWGGDGSGIEFGGGIPNYMTIQRNTLNFAETVGQIGSVVTDGKVLNVTDNSAMYFTSPYSTPQVTPVLTAVAGFIASDNILGWQLFGDSFVGPDAVTAYLTNFAGNVFINNEITNLRTMDATKWMASAFGLTNSSNSTTNNSVGANTIVLIQAEQGIRTGNR